MHYGYGYGCPHFPVLGVVVGLLTVTIPTRQERQEKLNKDAMKAPALPPNLDRPTTGKGIN
jgi:hypothetical protein